VKAQQIQWGAIHAAGILFDRLIKRPDWIDNLKNALVDPQIGLSFLAKELNDFEGQYYIDHVQCMFILLQIFFS
jgi:hypothetical protein